MRLAQFTEIDKVLKRYHNLQECILEEVHWREYGLVRTLYSTTSHDRFMDWRPTNRYRVLDVGDHQGIDIQEIAYPAPRDFTP